MCWIPYLLGTRITKEVPLTADSVEAYLDKASEALQERGFVPRSSSVGLRMLDSPDMLSGMLNNILPGSNAVVLRADLVRSETVRLTYDVRHLREFIAVVGWSVIILFSSANRTMLLTIPLFLGIALLLPYFFHIDHFKRIVKGPRDPFKHLN